MALRVLLVDDMDIVRNGLRVALGSERDIQIAVAADNFDSALSLAVEEELSLVVSELLVAGRPLTEFMAALKGRAPGAQVLVLTSETREAPMRSAISAGARAYVFKEDGYSELLEALRATARGGRFLSETVESAILDQYAERVASRHSAIAAPITSREREVLARIGQGQSNKMIAKDLRLSVKTVEKHRSNLMRKLGLHNTAAVTAYAIRQGLVAEALAPGRSVPAATTLASSSAGRSSIDFAAEGASSGALFFGRKPRT